MIWEILQMITGTLFFGRVFALIFSFVGVVVMLTESFSTPTEKRNILIIFIGVIVFTINSDR